MNKSLMMYQIFITIPLIPPMSSSLPDMLGKVRVGGVEKVEEVEEVKKKKEDDW
jgi:hypothetical protein